MAGDRARESCAERDELAAEARRLIQARLRQTVSAAAPPRFAPLPQLDVEEWMRGDAGHLHRAFDLTRVPVQTGGAVTARAGRRVLNLLAPLLAAQSSLNAANARVATVLLEQLAAQGRRIEELERQIEELWPERGR